MKLVAYQFRVTGNVQQNMEVICRALRYAAVKKADLIIYPECALTGYPPRDLPDAKCFDRAAASEAFRVLQDQADSLGISILLGSIAEDQGHFFNRAYLFSPMQPPRWYGKRALYGWDAENFTEGKEDGVFEFGGYRIGVRICYEVRFPEYFRELYRQKTDLNVVLFDDVSDRDDAARYDLIRGHIRTRAVENVCPILSVDAAHPFQTAPTMLTDASGAVLAEMERGREGLMVFDYEPAQPNFGERGRIEISDRLAAENAASCTQRDRHV